VKIKQAQNKTDTQVVDVYTGSVNDIITPYRNLKISGHKIKIVGDNTDVGVYFMHIATGNMCKVPANDIVVNNPGELIMTQQCWCGWHNSRVGGEVCLLGRPHPRPLSKGEEGVPLMQQGC
jgi:hypothetical protein